MTDDIKNAISSINSSITNVIVKKDSSGYTFFTIFALVTNPSMTDEITYNVTSVPLSKVWAEGKIAVSPDVGLENILSTTDLLTRLASASTDPVIETPGGSTSDSLSVKLLSSILFHRVIAHNSPVSDLLEEDNGIFTNYIQYFDDIVKNWVSVKGSIAGLPRLKAIYNRVLTQNSGIITDPVWAFNHGTLSEYGRPVEERKNYAFYEGYSRLRFDMERPVYSTGTHAGAGIMFRVSDNIELYKANPADTFNMFDTAIIDGAVARRLIVNVNDSMFRNIDTAGLWVLGIIPDNIDDKSNLAWYAGITAIRLPLNGMYGTGVKIDTAFSVSDEKSVKSDANGMIVGGAGSNVFKMYALEEEPQMKEDTVYNNVEPGIFLHHQRRIVEVDSNYFKSYDSLKFDIVGFDSAGKKIFVESTEGKYKATLKDTSQTEGDVQAQIYLDKLLVYVGTQSVLVSKLFSDEAKNGNLSKNLQKGRIYEIKVVDVNKLKLNKFPELDDMGTVKMSMSTNAALYTSSDCSNIWSADFKKVGNKNNNQTCNKQVLVKTWKEFKDLLNGKTSLFLKVNKSGTEEIKIELSWPGGVTRKYVKNTLITKEKLSRVVENLTFDFKYTRIVLEPITNERIPSTEPGAGELYNPSCVVKDDYASFKIDVDPNQIDPSRIKWHCKNNSVQFYDGGNLSDEGTGCIVRVKGNVVLPDGDKLIINIDGYDGTPPEISFNVLAKKEVNVYTYIVKNNSGTDSAFTDSDIDDAIIDGNLILKQIGVYLKRIKCGAILNNNYYILNNVATMKTLINQTYKNDGIEIYFVKGQYIDGFLGETYYRSGCVITKYGNLDDNDETINKFTSQVLVHEILHCMRIDMSMEQKVFDIYDDVYISGEFKGILDQKLKDSYIPLDWGTGYYESSRNIVTVMKKLLMYGKSIDNYDIPRGTVYGYGKDATAQTDADNIDCGGIVNLTGRIFVHDGFEVVP